MKQKLPPEEKSVATVIPMTFRLVSINILSFSIKNEDKIIKESDIVFEIGLENKTETKNNSIEVFTLVKVFSDKNKKTELGEVKTSNLFEIQNLDKLVVIEDKQSKLPEVLLASIIGISISNTRGILFAKAAGTVLSKAIIPVLNPTELIRNIIKK